MGLTDLRQFLRLLRSHREIADIRVEVDPHLELAEIHRRVVSQQGPALFFHRVKGSSFPVVTNLLGSPRRLALAFQNRPEELVGELVELLSRPLPPAWSFVWKKRRLLKALWQLGTRTRRHAPVLEREMTPANVHRLPLLTCWKEDGGAFLTLPLVYTESPSGGSSNLGLYRMQRFDGNHLGLHWQIGKGGAFHYHEAEAQSRALPVQVFLGGPPALLLSAIAPLPENVPELLLCALLQGKKVDVTRFADSRQLLLSHCEFALVGQAKPHLRHTEGPFGDHYGYYDRGGHTPVFECQRLFHRADALFPATVVGKPPQEDHYLGHYLQKLLSPLYPLVMPAVKALWSYGEAGFHAVASAVVRERYFREAMTSAFRILGEGQLGFTKCLFLTDQPVEVQRFSEVLTAILERFDPVSDLSIFSDLSLDDLEPTRVSARQGSRAVFVGLGEAKRALPRQFSGTLPPFLKNPRLFCPGCLVVEAPPFNTAQKEEWLENLESLKSWPLVILVDDAEAATRSDLSFLWTVFTRFEPASDIHASPTRIHRHHLCYSFPVVIDARKKPHYPQEVECDEETLDLVSSRWKDYTEDLSKLRL